MTLRQDFVRISQPNRLRPLPENLLSLNGDEWISLPLDGHLLDALYKAGLLVVLGTSYMDGVEWPFYGTEYVDPATGEIRLAAQLRRQPE